MTDAGTTTAAMACSFCLKPAPEVAKLVAGPGVFICNECVDLCQEIIGQNPDPVPDPAAWERDMGDEDLLKHLPRVAAAGAQVLDLGAGRQAALRREHVHGGGPVHGVVHVPSRVEVGGADRPGRGGRL